MTKPVTVVIPTMERRAKFLEENCLPSVKANEPKQISVLGGERPANVKRNEGARNATEPYLFFCDDDVVLMPDCLEKYLAALEVDPKAAFAYGGFKHVVYEGISFPLSSSVQLPGAWDPNRLKARNYISMMSLIRKDKFPGFDEELRRFEDWDLWLTILEAGGHAVYVNQVLHESHHFDKGLTVTEPELDWFVKVKDKHGFR